MHKNKDDIMTNIDQNAQKSIDKLTELIYDKYTLNYKSALVLEMCLLRGGSE